MLILASLAFHDTATMITPEEPATLQLALVGLGTLAVYGVMTGWRSRKTTPDVAAEHVTEHFSATTPAHDKFTQRAA